MKLDSIRNFSIVAHIDHGKSTLADRIIQTCGGIEDRKMRPQLLDSMDIERERGITIKAQSVSLSYTSKDKKIYTFNLIDTPGHVDFSYEVSRSLSACEGFLLVVDASQGVEAQTLSVCYEAISQGLEIIPVLNKIDLKHADVEKVKEEIKSIVGIETDDSVLTSAKTGLGISDLLEKVIKKIPCPTGNSDDKLQALIIDSWFDKYLGVVSLIRVFSGKLNKGDSVRIMSTNKDYTVDKLGVFTPEPEEKDCLLSGEVGFLHAGIKEIKGAPVGDTLTLSKLPASQSLPGFLKVKPQVFAGLFPVDSGEFENFKTALLRLNLNDSSLFYEIENSPALGLGFRCGFLGMLHMEIIQERLEREHDLDLIVTAPTVVYKVIKKDGKEVFVDNPNLLPEKHDIDLAMEPMSEVSILTPPIYLGEIIQLCISRRGIQKQISYSNTQTSIIYEIPTSEVILNFFDQIKSISKGFASLDYKFSYFRESDIVKLDLLINGEKVDALSVITHREKAAYQGRILVEKLKDLIPRQMFDVAIQSAIGGKILARSTVKSLRKNVTAKCYGGDVSRKKKLLEKQKKGKNRMKKIGNVYIPKTAFASLLKIKK